MPKLKSCPFCGGKAKFVDYGQKDDFEALNIECVPDFEAWNIQCVQCGILAVIPGEDAEWITTKDEAAKAWNRRVYDD